MPPNSKTIDSEKPVTPNSEFEISPREILVAASIARHNGEHAAAEIQQARLTADTNHVQAVAQALADKKPTPARSQAHQELIASDEHTAAALAILRKKHADARYDFEIAEHSAAIAGAKCRLALRTERLGRAFAAMRSAMDVISDEYVRKAELSLVVNRLLDTAGTNSNPAYLQDRQVFLTRANAVSRPIESAVSNWESGWDLIALSNSGYSEIKESVAAIIKAKE